MQKTPCRSRPVWTKILLPRLVPLLANQGKSEDILKLRLVGRDSKTVVDRILACFFQPNLPTRDGPASKEVLFQALARLCWKPREKDSLVHLQGQWSLSLNKFVGGLWSESMESWRCELKIVPNGRCKLPPELLQNTHWISDVWLTLPLRLLTHPQYTALDVQYSTQTCENYQTFPLEQWIHCPLATTWPTSVDFEKKQCHFRFVIGRGKKQRTVSILNLAPRYDVDFYLEDLPESASLTLLCHRFEPKVVLDMQHFPVWWFEGNDRFDYFYKDGAYEFEHWSVQGTPLSSRSKSHYDCRGTKILKLQQLEQL